MNYIAIRNLIEKFRKAKFVPEGMISYHDELCNILDLLNDESRKR